MPSLAAVAPTWSSLLDFHDTSGPEVGDVAKLAGFDPDPEQQMVLDQLFAFDRHGDSVAFETAVVAPRQNLKTAVCKMAALGWLFITEQRLVVWSAHEFRTAQEAFRDMTELVESSPDLDREVKAIYRGNGDEAIELLNGCRLIFKARTKGGGRGLTGDKVVLDEAFALRPVHMGALLPTLAARPDPQVLYGSSAGMVDSDVLRGIRDRGRKGDDRRLAYFEWGDLDPGTCDIDGCDHALGTPGCALDDRSRWERANPAYGRRITEESLTAFRQALPPEEFAREFLGWWDEPAASDHDVSVEEWLAVESDAAPSGELSLAVDVGPNQAWSSIVACGNGVLEVVERRRGASWLAGRMVELAERHPVAEFGLDPAGPIGALLPELEREGLPVRLLDGKDAVRACGAFVAGVSDKTLSHRGEPELLTAVGGASRRAVGDGWKWSRKDSSVDISPLVAATYAHWLWLSREGAPISPEIYFV